MLSNEIKKIIQYSDMKITKESILDIKALQEYLIYCKSAITILETELSLISDEFDIMEAYNPIDHIKCRVKSIDSIIAKAERKGMDLSIKDIENRMTDIVGVRIVCPFLSDVYQVLNILRDNKKFKILQEQDYISQPKPCGYSSYHMIVEVPVNLTKGYKDIKAEIQIRTLGMDFWATLEHKLNYKVDNNFNSEITNNLYNNATKIHEIDRDMDALAKVVIKSKTKSS